MRQLKSLRILYDLTQKDMAEKLNISTVTYRDKENGKKDFTLTEARMISEVFHKTIEAIFFEN